MSKSKTSCPSYNTIKNDIAFLYKNKATLSEEQEREKISLQIQLCLAKRNLTLGQLAELAGVTKMQVFRWKQKLSKPQQRHVEKLRALGVLE